MTQIIDTLDGRIDISEEGFALETPQEKRADQLRVQLHGALLQMRTALHEDVDRFIREASDFLANPLRDIMQGHEGTPAEAVEEWRARGVAAKQQLLDAFEKELARVRPPSGELVALLRTMTHHLPPPLPGGTAVIFAELPF